MNTKKILRIALVVLLLTTIVAAAATSWTASAGTDFLTASGVEVSLLSDEEIESGDLFTSTSVKLQNVTFHGNNATVSMYPGQWNGTWTNVTAMNVLAGNLTLRRPSDILSLGSDGYRARRVSRYQTRTAHGGDCVVRG